MAAKGLRLVGFPLDSEWAWPRPGVLGLAWAQGAPAHSRHGVSAPAPLCAGPGYRFRGFLSGWVGVPGPCQREPPPESLALLSEFQ